MIRSRLLIPALTFLTAGFLLTACDKNDNPDTISTKAPYGGVINGLSEKPTSTTSTATGTVAATLNETTRVGSYTVTYSGLTPTMGHLHRVTANSATGTGGVEVPFASLTSPIIGSFTLANQARVDSFKNGFYYANLHTTAYPAGEIRGDIKKQ
ncbi:hypothetical protein GCM10027578_19070 [Spirosoma luteolum]